jgi:hypothetical protein
MALKTDLTGMLTEGLFQPTQEPIPSSYRESVLRSVQRAGEGVRRGVGALTGADTMTTRERANKAMQGLDINNPADQPKILEVVRKYAPEREAALVAQFAQQGRVRAEKESKTEAAVSYVEAVFPDKPELIDLAKKGISIAEIKSIGKGEKDYAVVGNSVYIPSTGEFIQGPKTKSGSAIKPNKEFNEETGQNELVWREPTDPTVVLKRVKAPTDTAGVTATVEKIMKTNRELEQAERATELEATTLANEYEKLLGDVNSGIFKTIEEGYKAITGRQDKLTSLYLAADRLRVGRGVKNLPVGPASDKDVALVMQGELPENAAPKEIVEYARGIAKLARIGRQDAALENSWYDRYGDARGLGSQREKERLEESFAGFPEGAIAELEADMSDEAIKEFNEAFQVDYLDMRTKLERANKTLEELNRGF